MSRGNQLKKEISSTWSLKRLKWITLIATIAVFTLGVVLLYSFQQYTLAHIIFWLAGVLSTLLVIEFAYRQAIHLQREMAGRLAESRQQETQQAALLQISSRLSTARTGSEITQTIVDAVQNTLGYAYAQLRWVHAEAAMLQMDSREQQSITRPIELPDPAWKHITLPLRASGELIGDLTVADPGDRLGTRSELEFLSAVANQTSIALSNMRLIAEQSLQREDAEGREVELRNRERYLTLLNEITRAGMRQDDLNTMLQTIADHLGQMFSADSVLVTLWDETRSLPVPVAAFGHLRQMVRSLRIEPGDLPLTASVLKSGRALVIDDVRASAYVSSRLSVPLQARSMLALPLLIDEQKLGAAILTFRQHHTFTEREILLGEQAASQVALAIVKNRALTTAQHRAQELAALQKATSALLGTLDLDNLLSQILDAAMSAISAAEKGSLHLAAPDTGQLQIRAIYGYNDPRIQIFNPTNSASFPARAVRNRASLIIVDAQTDPEHHKSDIPELRAIASLIVAPLLLGDQALGAISLESYHRYAFTTDDLNLLVSFAATATTAIRNAQLHAEVQQQATIDALTGTFNRRVFFEMGFREVERARRFQRPLSILMIDADNFKQVNDTLGHTIGDRVLARLAAQLSHELRQVDTLGRYGGDEFLALLPETDLARSQQVAERLRSCVEASFLPPPEANAQAEMPPLTISIGAAALSYPDDTLETLVERADQALYSAKESGRNRVAVSG
jgi:diguanylate cyclase (GGDEF)-like protein